jgi:hypothetical protein
MPDYGVRQMEPLNFRVCPEDYRLLEKIAADTGQTISDIGREAIARYLGRSGIGTRTKSRLDRLEDQVNRLTLLVVQPQGSRADQAATYLEIMNP